MKPVSVIFLMGAAALAGGLLVRYSDHPVVIATSRSLPPAVVAPPVPPSPAIATPPAPEPAAVSAPAPDPVPAGPEKPSAFSQTVHIRQAKPAPRIVPEPQLVTPIETARAVPVPSPAPAPIQVPEPAPVAKNPLVPAPRPEPEPNEVTLKSGTLLTIRINEALSSDRNGQGEVFTGSLTQPLIADGFAIAERGARVKGFVVDVRAAGGSSPAELTLRLREVATSDGQWVHISTSPWIRRGIAGNILIRPEAPLTFRLDQSTDVVERR